MEDSNLYQLASLYIRYVSLGRSANCAFTLLHFGPIIFNLCIYTLAYICVATPSPLKKKEPELLHFGPIIFKLVHLYSRLHLRCNIFPPEEERTGASLTVGRVTSRVAVLTRADRAQPSFPWYNLTIRARW